MSLTASTVPKSPADEPRWESVVKRDATADSAFVYAVKTTRVYCRPSCPSRRAKRQNVSFFATPAEAEAAGFHACLRCRPKGPSIAETSAAIVAQACREIEGAEEPLKLETLAAAVNVSPYHLHRLFKRIIGITPHAYLAARRAELLRKELAEGNTSVTDAIYAAGYSSSSRFYEKSDDLLGMTPTAFRRGGAHETIRFAVGRCTLGEVLVAATEKGVCAIMLGDDPEGLGEDLRRRFPAANLIGGDADFQTHVAQVVALVEAPASRFDLPLDIRGSAFQQKVWQTLREIPAGATRSYRDVAERIGQPSAARAVAQACGANKIAVAIPCHRVVRTDGSISGYRWGVERKRVLLAREGADRVGD